MVATLAQLMFNDVQDVVGQHRYEQVCIGALLQLVEVGMCQ